MIRPRAAPSTTVVSRAMCSFRYTARRILEHPANRDRRGRALVLYLAWQVWQRVVRRPWTIRLGNTRRIRLYPHSVVAAFVLYYRIHDYEDMSFVRTYLHPGDLFVDVGANVGVYSLWASEAVGVKVIAFEPSSTTFARAVENVQLNGIGDQVRVLQKAVGADVGDVQLTLSRDALNRVTDETGESTETVQQTTLDVELRSQVPALIKIDVEGGELAVLRGGRNCITRHRPALLIEVNDPAGLSEVLDELGYQAWSYDPGARTLSRTEPALNTNVLALADVEAAQARIGPMTLVPSSPPGDRTPLPHGIKSVLLQRVPVLRLLLLRRDFLRESGWLASSRRNAPVGRDGSPLPWYTYPAVDFLANRVRSDMSVFEYGAGNSTLWWAERVAHVSSVESNRHWMALLEPTLPANACLRFEPADGADYPTSATRCGRQFDVIVIDGMERNACAFACLPALKDDGVLIWDNSDWSTLWAEGMGHLTTNGFRRLDFRGPGPLAWRPWTTSVFYRSGSNCLGI